MFTNENLEVKKSYNTGDSSDDVLQNFYVPVLAETYRYDRVAGYFSSRVFSSIAKGITGLVRNEGKLRIITSHVMTASDVKAIEENINDNWENSKLIDKFLYEFKKDGNLENIIISNHLGAFCWLLREGHLEIKIVVPSKHIDSYNASDMEKFHPKLGNLYDAEDNCISFSGSINETATAWEGNIENFNVFKSWNTEQNDYVISNQKIFEKYWNNDIDEKWEVLSLPTAIVRKLVTDYGLQDFPNLQKKKKKLVLRDYQEEAVIAWKQNGRRGVLEMATGTGKTLTSLACAEDASLEGSLLTIIVVPYSHIGHQWQKVFSNRNSLFVSGQWRSKLEKIYNDLMINKQEILTLVVVKNTASSDDFIKIIEKISKKFKNTLMIGDEVHWLGAFSYQKALYDFANFRLGLSATPKRYFDDMGTNTIMNYFGSEDSVFTLSLAKALNLKDINGKNILCPYVYNPIAVKLSEIEIETYNLYSKKIATTRNIKNKTPEDMKKLELLYNQRSFVFKEAEDKIESARRLFLSLENNLKKCIVYCSTFDQLNKIAAILSNLNINYNKITGVEGTNPTSYYNDISEREHLINDFTKGHIDVLLAIDCLDEGVDIPSAKLGIILASSGNPKEFIQRRGRLMRPHDSKTHAIIYDFCVLPIDNDDPLNKLNGIKVEYSRILEFGSDAMNKTEIYKKYNLLGERND